MPIFYSERCLILNSFMSKQKIITEIAVSSISQNVEDDPLMATTSVWLFGDLYPAFSGDLTPSHPRRKHMGQLPGN